MSRTYRLVVGPADAGKRLDRYLVRHLPSSTSRSMIQRTILSGGVTVNECCVKTHRLLRAGEVVIARCEWLPATATRISPVPQPIALDVVYEDTSLLVINKPPGLVTHPAPGHWDGTLVNAVLWHLQKAQGPRFKAQGSGLKPRALSLERALPRAGIVHRLDQGTSGLLLVAKTEPARFELSKQLKDRMISRRYLALVEGEVPLDYGTVNASMGRHQRHRKIMTVRHVGGRSAVTHYRVLKRFGPDPFVYTLLEVTLETGRTHQVRVHMAHLGHPVLGDATYGKCPASYWLSFGISRQMLHASRLSFRHPRTKQPMTLTAPLPDDMVPWLPDMGRSV